MNIFPIFNQADDEATDVQVGTTETALERPRLVAVDGVLRDAGAIPTGANAQRSLQDRWRNFIAGDKKDKDAFFPQSTRSARRAQDRAARTTQRKHQRGYFRRERAKEEAARDLLNLFLLADGATKADPFMRARAANRIADRVKYLRDQQQKTYDKALAARANDRSLPAPTPPQRHEEIRAQLWLLAQTAVLPAAKGETVPLTKGQQIHQLAQSRLDATTGHPVVG